MKANADEVVRVRRFFEQELPARLASSAGLVASSRGTIAFVVPGAGEWLVRFGARLPASALEATTCLEADLTLMASPQAFARLLSGETPKVGAGFTVEGNLKLLNLFARVVEGARGLIALRAANG